MPNRMIRDWTDSLRMDGLSAEAERLFIRLIMKADDYGRFHGELRLVKANCFPLAEGISSRDIESWLLELSNRGLIILYEAGGRKLLAIANYGQRLRTSREKFLPMAGTCENWLPTFDDLQPIPVIPQHSADNCPRLPATSGDFRPEENTKRREYEAEVEEETEPEDEVETPKPPKGDVAGSAKPKPKADLLPTTEEAKKIAQHYHRRLTTAWDKKEIKAFKELQPINPEELDLVFRYQESERAKGDDGWHKRDLQTFLNQFGKLLDRARGWEKQPGLFSQAGQSSSAAARAEAAKAVDIGDREGSGKTVKLSELTAARKAAETEKNSQSTENQ